MTEFKRIPHSWELSERNKSIWAISPRNARVRIAYVVKHSPMNGIDHEAIARLIVAAPETAAQRNELLCAAKLVIERWQTGDLAEAVRLLAEAVEAAA